MASATACPEQSIRTVYLRGIIALATAMIIATIVANA